MSDNVSDKVFNQSNLVKLRREKGVQHEYNIKPESYDKELKEAQQKLEKIQQIEQQIQKIEEKELRRSSQSRLSQSRLSNSDQEELTTGETQVEEVFKAKHDSVKSEPAAEPPSRNESLDQSLTEISQSILSDNMLDDSVLEPVGENSEEDQEKTEEQTEDQTETHVKNSKPTTAQKFEDIIGEMTDEIEKSYEAEANCRNDLEMTSNDLERDEIIEPETPNDSLVEVPDQTPTESFNDSIPIPEYYTKDLKSEIQGEDDLQTEPVTKSENIPTFITEVPSDKDISESETNVDLPIQVHSVTEQIPSPQPQIQEEELIEARNSFVSTSSFEEKTMDPEVTCVNSEELNESKIPEIQTSMEPQGKIHSAIVVICYFF